MQTGPLTFDSKAHTSSEGIRVSSSMQPISNILFYIGLTKELLLTLDNRVVQNMFVRGPGPGPGSSEIGIPASGPCTSANCVSDSYIYKELMLLLMSRFEH